MPRIATLLALALLASCASTTQDPGANAGVPAPTGTDIPLTLPLGLGESAALPDGSRLTYLRLVNDSRCPPDVQCVWAGDAEIRLRWQPARGGPASEASLHTSTLQGRQADRAFGPYRVHLEALERGIAPKATLRIDRE